MTLDQSKSKSGCGRRGQRTKGLTSSTMTSSCISAEERAKATQETNICWGGKNGQQTNIQRFGSSSSACCTADLRTVALGLRRVGRQEEVDRPQVLLDVDRPGQRRREVEVKLGLRLQRETGMRENCGLWSRETTSSNESRLPKAPNELSRLSSRTGDPWSSRAQGMWAISDDFN